MASSSGTGAASSAWKWVMLMPEPDESLRARGEPMARPRLAEPASSATILHRQRTVIDGDVFHIAKYYVTRIVLQLSCASRRRIPCASPS